MPKLSPLYCAEKIQLPKRRNFFAELLVARSQNLLAQMRFLGSLLLPKYPINHLCHCPCPPTHDWGSRVSDLVVIVNMEIKEMKLKFSAWLLIVLTQTNKMCQTHTSNKIVEIDINRRTNQLVEQCEELHQWFRVSKVTIFYVLVLFQMQMIFLKALDQWGQFTKASFCLYSNR